MKLIKDISIGKLLFLFIFALIVGFSSMLPMVFLYNAVDSGQRINALFYC
ncbi:MAG TPA: hypothetical protein GX498_00735 [Clostridiales bacterium]|nr:hypothetical protein [Clostridiales bacterium]